MAASESPPPCGTVGGDIRHRRRGDPHCKECKAAMRRYNADVREARELLRNVYPAEYATLREKEKQGPKDNAWNRANVALAANHRDEYRALLAKVRGL